MTNGCIYTSTAEPTMRGAMRNKDDIQTTNYKDSVSPSSNGNFPVTFDSNNPPRPGQETTTPQKKTLKTWVIVVISITSVVLLTIFTAVGFFCFKKRGRGKYTSVLPPPPSMTSDIKKGKSKSWEPGSTSTSTSNSEPNPNSFLKAKGRVRTFTQSVSSVFKPKRWHDRSDQRTRDPGFESITEKSSSYANVNLNHADPFTTTTDHDEDFIAPSPPPTPAVAYGWNSTGVQSAPKTKAGSNSNEKSPVLEKQDTSYQNNSRASLLLNEKDSLIGGGDGNDNDKRGRDRQSRQEEEEERRRRNRQSTDWDDRYQSRPRFDPFEDEPRVRDDPDSRSGL